MSLPALWSRWQAARRRAGGRYDPVLLAWAYRAARGGAVADLCRLALWRRDLGRPLPRRWVAPLRDGLAQLPAAQRCLALGLLAEAAPAALAGLPAGWLDEAARQPGVALALGRAQPLAPVATFEAWLAAQRPRGHCVVGNAASLAGRGLGAQIDAAGVVWRFNHWQGPAAQAADQGRRCDVWVLSPALRQAPLPAGLRWAVLSGPDVRYTQRGWGLVTRLQQAGVGVVCVPLPVWRGCVAALQAPPSAGLLSLAWLRGQGAAPAPWAGVRALGIGEGRAAAYHLADRRARAGSRHDWDAEAALLARWRAEGLG